MPLTFNPSQKSPGFSQRDECRLFSAQEGASDFSPRGSTPMPDSMESLIRIVYTEWKAEESKKLKTAHPDPELLAAFLEKPLPAKEDQGIKLHLILCESCSEALAAQMVIEIDITQEAPSDLIKWAKALPVYRSNAFGLAKMLRLKKKFLLRLSAQKLIAALLSRQRQLKLRFNYR